MAPHVAPLRAGCHTESTHIVGGCPRDGPAGCPGDATAGCPGVAQQGAGAGGRQAHPPDGHGILTVDLLHGLDVSVQLRVTVEVGGAGPLWHSTPRHRQTRRLPCSPALRIGLRVGVP